MERLEIEELEENIKTYDANYKPKKVLPGSIVDIIIEYNNQVSSQIVYLGEKKELDKTMDLEGIGYELVKKSLLDCYKDETIEINGAKITIAEIYSNMEEYSNRNINGVLVNIGSVVDVIHNGVDKKYHIVKNAKDAAFQNGIDDIMVNTPLAQSLLSKKQGDIAHFDVALNKNRVLINYVYKNLNDYNKQNGICIIKPGAIVDITIDGIPFIFNYVSNESENKNEILDEINMDIPLGKELFGKTAGDSFVYEKNGLKMNGYVNKVYNSMDQYINEMLNNNKAKTL